MSSPPKVTAPNSDNLVIGAAGLTTDDQTNAAQRRLQGEFVRGISSARHWISKQAPTTDENNSELPPPPHYPPASGRYHMIVAYNCPWCHRILVARALLGLEEAITVDVVYPNRSNDDEPLGPNLWKFCPEGQDVPIGWNQRLAQFPECTMDTVFGGEVYVKTIYERCGVLDQKSVPILLDRKTKTIVNNESAEIVRMLGTEMKEFGTNSGIDLYPTAQRDKIDQINDWIYTTIANGSYKAGFSSNQDIYEAAFASYFEALDQLDDMLKQSRFLVGSTVTEADVRLFPPLFRHDPIYYNRFKLNHKYLWEYPNIWRWMSDMVALPGMDAVSNAGYLAHCKQGYFGRTGNGTIPVGPTGYPDCFRDPNWIPPSVMARSRLLNQYNSTG